MCLTSVMVKSLSGPACLATSCWVCVGKCDVLRAERTAINSGNNPSTTSPRRCIGSSMGLPHSARMGCRVVVMVGTHSCISPLMPTWSNGFGRSTSTTLSYRACISSGKIKRQKNNCSVACGLSGFASEARKANRTRAAAAANASAGLSDTADKAACANSAAPPVKDSSRTKHHNQSVAVTSLCCFSTT